MIPKPLLPWLRLCRLPTVFTALADICVGFLLTHQHWSPISEFGWLLGASAGLYLSGMVFNDIFDLSQDRAERPNRPIPSGAVSFRAAICFAFILMGTGIVCSTFVSINSLLISLLISIAILAYDGGLKKTPLGPLAMGTCRFLNILLGASSGVAGFSEVWSLPQIWMAAAMGIYITGVTWFARTEAKVSQRFSLFTALVVADCGLLFLAAWMLGIPKRLGLEMGPVGLPEGSSILLLWALLALSINHRAVKAIAEPVPGRVQPAIGNMLFSIISLDAMMIFFRLGPSGLTECLLTLALMLPTIALRRWISMT